MSDVPPSKIRVVLALLLVFTSVALVTAQSKPEPNKTEQESAAETLRIEIEKARVKQYLDKEGGYKDNEGGYYNPKAGTYTDKEGGVVDNWQGYTYKDGSYKSGLGDFWDAKTKTFKLTSGETLKSNDTTSEDAITVLRQSVEEQKRYDKNLSVKSMIARIKMEHPTTLGNTQKHP